MRLVIQRVNKASVTISEQLFSSIQNGLFILVGVERGDTEDDAKWLASKVSGMRLFNDDQGIMNRSVVDAGGELLAVSQFTLTASTRKGNRPSYIRAAGHDIAIPLYDKFCDILSDITKIDVKKGVFGADMQCELINDGPVTIIIDSKLKE